MNPPYGMKLIGTLHASGDACHVDMQDRKWAGIDHKAEAIVGWSSILLETIFEKEAVQLAISYLMAEGGR